MIDYAKQGASDGHLFPGMRKGVISDMSMAAVMKRRQFTARPHGFRTSLRVWANTQKDLPFEAREMALAHKVGTSVTQSYNRDDFFDDRADLMSRWGSFVMSDTIYK